MIKETQQMPTRRFLRMHRENKHIPKSTKKYIQGQIDQIKKKLYKR